MAASFAVYAFVFPFAVVLLSFGWMPWGMEWMSSLLLIMLGLASAGWLWTNLGGAGLTLSLALLVAGIALEFVGVETGFPFGAYRYTGVLLPELPGGVPLAIGFAWLLVVTGGVFTAGRLAVATRLHSLLVRVALMAALGALLAVGLDLLLEPVAFHIKGYWQWLPVESGYYGIPWSNFVAWLVAAFVFSLPAAALGLSKRTRHTVWPKLPVALYAMNVLMFGIVNAAHGYWVAGLVGLLLLAVAARAAMDEALGG